MLFNSRSQNNFILHNKRIFNQSKNTFTSDVKKIFLLEFNKWHILHIISSYFISLIKKNNSPIIIAYANYRIYEEKNHFYENIKWLFGKLLNIRNFAVYRSFGVNNFIIAQPSKKNLIEAKIISLQLLKKIKKKNDIINISVNNIWIGDLIYDSFLKAYNLPTIDFFSKNFETFLVKSVALFLFWQDFFKLNKINGLACVHAVYLDGLPVRIAAKYNITSYNLDNNKIFRILKKDISKKKGYSGTANQFRFYVKIFHKLPNKHKLLELGKKNLENIISGKKKYHYMINVKPSALKYNKKNKFNFNNKLKVLIYAHSFFDSPHVYGKFLFPDFYEWIKFLGKISLETDYDWYIKPHPNSNSDLDIVTIKDLIKDSSIKIISDKMPIDSLFKSIDFALTVYGTVASELSYYGIKVINASHINPHTNYNFSLSPKNLINYEKIIRNLNNINFTINKKDLYEYHYMKEYYFGDNIFFDNKFIYKKRKFGERDVLYTEKAYDFWLKKYTVEEHKKINKIITNFINSKDYCINISHLK